MENQRPLILISNDDGVIAKGISELIKFLRPLGEIVVMAPDAPRSGNASALTVTEPIHYQLVRKDVGLTIYKCSGSPVDCVKLAFHTVLDRKPDLVVGGINHGDNSAVNVHYSLFAVMIRTLILNLRDLISARLPVRFWKKDCHR